MRFGHIHRGYVDQLLPLHRRSFRLKGKTYRYLTDPPRRTRQGA
jgi:hypothetical protein